MNNSDSVTPSLLPHAIEADNHTLTLNLLSLQEKYSKLLEHSKNLSSNAVKDIDSAVENHILISQLFQAQDAVESYHNLCTEILKTLQSTEHSLDKAQKIIETLINKSQR